MLETAWESRWLPDYCGGVAQLGEHLPCKQGVKSSNLSISIQIDFINLVIRNPPIIWVPSYDIMYIENRI